MGSFTDFLENAFVNHLCNAAFTPSATLFVALATSSPGDAATGATMFEVANANGYARSAITFGAATNRRVISNAIVTFPQATGSWGAVSDWAIVTSATYGAGNVYAYGSFTTPFTPVAGNTPSIPSGEVQVQVQATAAGAGFTDYFVHNWLNRAFRNLAFAKPLTYIGLALTIIGDQSVAITDLTEVSTAGTAYARALVNPNGGSLPTWTSAPPGTSVITNQHLVQYPIATASWGQVLSCFLIDSTSGAGNVMAYDNANVQDQTPLSGDTVQFAINAFSITCS